MYSNGKGRKSQPKHWNVLVSTTLERKVKREITKIRRPYNISEAQILRGLIKGALDKLTLDEILHYSGLTIGKFAIPAA